MYQLGCDRRLYQYKDKEWKKINDKRGAWISSSKDALWIRDTSNMLFRFDEETA